MRLDHPNIIQIYEYFQSEKRFYIVTDLCEGGELFYKISQEKQFTEGQVANIMKQLLSAIAYCHKLNIVHRDIKPENIVFETKKDFRIKLIDFGSSKDFVKNEFMTKVQGTSYYVAPEILKERYNEKCDVWACGVILYILLTGDPPFNGMNDSKILEKIKKGKYLIKHDKLKHVSSEARQLIKGMLKLKPTKRLTAFEAVNHEWFDKIEISPSSKVINLQILQNLQTINFKSRIQKAIYYFLIKNTITKEEMKESLYTFQSLDTHGEGFLSRQDIKEGYIRAGFSETKVDALMEHIDDLGSNGLNYSEFIAATLDREKYLTQKKIESCFKLFDKNRNGWIPKDELKLMFKGANVNEEQWDDIINEIDNEQDGIIQFDEFKELLFNLI